MTYLPSKMEQSNLVMAGFSCRTLSTSSSSDWYTTLSAWIASLISDSLRWYATSSPRLGMSIP